MTSTVSFSRRVIKKSCIQPSFSAISGRLMQQQTLHQFFVLAKKYISGSNSTFICLEAKLDLRSFVLLEFSGILPSASTSSIKIVCLVFWFKFCQESSLFIAFLKPRSFENYYRHSSELISYQETVQECFQVTDRNDLNKSFDEL